MISVEDTAVLVHLRGFEYGNETVDRLSRRAYGSERCDRLSLRAEEDHAFFVTGFGEEDVSLTGFERTGVLLELDLLVCILTDYGVEVVCTGISCDGQRDDLRNTLLDGE